MKWLSRTDHARRTKGDPAPTYAQLEARVAYLEAECSELDQRNARLRTANRALRESNLRLINDANQLRQRLPKLADEDVVVLDPGVGRPYIPDVRGAPAVSLNMRLQGDERPGNRLLRLRPDTGHPAVPRACVADEQDSAVLRFAPERLDELLAFIGEHAATHEAGEGER